MAARRESVRVDKFWRNPPDGNKGAENEFGEGEMRIRGILVERAHPQAASVRVHITN
jgi:hypothetical protein